jgi:hypothetical protein
MPAWRSRKVGSATNSWPRRASRPCPKLYPGGHGPAVPEHGAGGIGSHPGGCSRRLHDQAYSRDAAHAPAVVQRVPVTRGYTQTKSMRHPSQLYFLHSDGTVLRERILPDAVTDMVEGTGMWVAGCRFRPRAFHRFSRCCTATSRSCGVTAQERFSDRRLFSFQGQMHSLHFPDIRDANRVRSIPLKRDSLHLHIFADEEHQLFPLTVVGHLVRDWQLQLAILRENTDRRASLHAFPHALQAQVSCVSIEVLHGACDISH